jgi:hypothetical protein
LKKVGAEPHFHREKPFRFIVDAHEDIVDNAMEGRDFRLSALEKRKLEKPPHSDKGVTTLGLPELLQADVRIRGTASLTPNRSQVKITKSHSGSQRGLY